MLCWLSEKKMQKGGKYILRHTTREAKCMIKDIHYKLDISNFQKITENHEVGLNDIVSIHLKSATPLFFDSYADNRLTGSLILIDEFTNETVGAGMII
jgi:sulfate adenylyltransferase subunit 1